MVAQLAMKMQAKPAPTDVAALSWWQGLTLVHFSAQPKPVWSLLPVSRCLIDREIIIHPTYPTRCA